MDLKDFEIGKIFWTGSGRWKCYDIGTKTVVAIKWEPHDVKGRISSIKEGKRVTERVVWHRIPSKEKSIYYQTLTTFFDYDFPGCWKTKKEYKQIMGKS